jgi:peptide/nickel transport system substrate-binding protein
MRKVSIVLVLALALLLILTACAPTPATTGTATTTAKPTTSATLTTLTPKYGGTLRIVPRLGSKIFGYPGDMNVSAAVDISTPCLEPLCGANIKGEFTPTKLSTAYEVAPDGQSITFTLRKGVKFHDGTNFNAEAAKWNLEQLKKARAVGTESWVSLPETVDVIDDYTVRINLKEYTNTFIGQVASVSRISSPAAFEQFGIDKIHTYPVGTGPFKFVSYEPDVSIKWERNDDYWGGKPYLDGLVTVYISDDMAKSAALQSNGVDILFNVTSETGIALRDKGYSVTAGGQESLACMAPDSANADSPLSKQKVREAIEYAIDRNALSQLGNGFWMPAFQPSTPNSPGFVLEFKGRQHDLEKAKQLMTEAGYPSGFNLKFIFSTSNVTPVDTMTVVAQFLSKIGITSDLQQMPSNQRTDISMNGWQNGFITLGIFSSLNYLSGVQYNFSPNGVLFKSMARPEGFGDILEQAIAARDVVTAAQFAEKVNMKLYENASVIPLWVAPQQIYVQQNYVQDAGLYSTGAQYDWTPEKAWINK